MAYNTVNISYTSAEPYAEVEGTVWVGETLYFSFLSDVEFSLENKYKLLVYLGDEDFIVSFFPLDQSTEWEIIDGKLVGLVTLNTKQLVDYYNSGVFVDNIKFALYNNNAEPIRLCYGDITCNGIQSSTEEPIDIDFLIKSYSNHTHTGLDGSKKINHSDLLEAGTKSHEELETDISNINSDISFIRQDIVNTNSTVEALGATVGSTTVQFQQNNNEHLDFTIRMDNTDSAVANLANRVITNENTFQSKLDENTQIIKEINNKNYLYKDGADNLYLAKDEYNKKVHCNILAPVNTLADLPGILNSSIGDIRLVLSEGTAYVRYYDDDGSGVNGWAALGGGGGGSSVEKDPYFHSWRDGEKVSLGKGAVATEGAIQLGEGTNTSAGSAKFFDKVIMDSNGQIPVERLSSNFFTKTETETKLEEVGKTQLDHEKNYDNPHRVKASQLTEKSPTSGGVNATTDTGSSVNIDADPQMYNELNLSFVAINNSGVEVMNLTNEPLYYHSTNEYGHIEFRGTQKYTIIGIECVTFLRIYIGLGSGLHNIMVGYIAEWGEIIDYYTTDTDNGSMGKLVTFEYTQSGTYQVLTEAMLRDKVTGKAFTICVENGELKLQEYRATKYEA